ncbi:MAG: hypothetical protein WA947_07215 [Phormidesmis sp.]
MGLFEAIFGKSAPKDDTAQKQAFYLSDDDAKSFGNIDYMRSNKTVRRTFAKKKGQTEHMESIRQISAMKKVNLDGSPVKGQASYGVSESTASTPNFSDAPTPSFENKSAPKSPAQSSSSTTRRKPSSSDMDMFRDMAKKIGK